MHLFSKSTLALALLLGCSAAISSYAQPSHSPVYSRQRSNSYGRGDWNGSGFPYGSPHPRHYGGQGYYPNQQAISGSWYARPYPHHFDYYRQRLNAPLQTNDCPCAKTQADP